MCNETLRVVSSAGSSVYRLNLPAQTVVPLSWGETEAQLWLPSIREDGREVTLQAERNRLEYRHGWTVSNGLHQPATLPTVQIRTCRTQFRNLASGTVVMDPAPCRHDGGVGGFSADVVDTAAENK